MKLLLLQSEFTPLMAGASVVRTVESSVARRHPEADALAVRLRKEMDMSDTGCALLPPACRPPLLTPPRRLTALPRRGATFAGCCSWRWAQLRGLVMARDMPALRKLAANEKGGAGLSVRPCVCGYAPAPLRADDGWADAQDFAEACNEAGLREEAVEMANMIKSMKKRLAVLGAIGCVSSLRAPLSPPSQHAACSNAAARSAWWTAAEVALQHRKFDELEGIMDKCGDETLRARILRAMEK